jgi:hypothetical protein
MSLRNIIWKSTQRMNRRAWRKRHVISEKERLTSNGRSIWLKSALKERTSWYNSRKLLLCELPAAARRAKARVAKARERKKSD